jgi:hypothetical protein
MAQRAQESSPELPRDDDLIDASESTAMAQQNLSPGQRRADSVAYGRLAKRLEIKTHLHACGGGPPRNHIAAGETAALSLTRLGQSGGGSTTVRMAPAGRPWGSMGGTVRGPVRGPKRRLERLLQGAGDEAVGT